MAYSDEGDFSGFYLRHARWRAVNANKRTTVNLQFLSIAGSFAINSYGCGADVDYHSQRKPAGTLGGFQIISVVCLLAALVYDSAVKTDYN